MVILLALIFRINFDTPESILLSRSSVKIVGGEE